MSDAILSVPVTAGVISAPLMAGPGFSVVHPLDDLPEAKLFRPELGRMRMTPQVRIALFGLQLYLVTMVSLLGWRLFTAM